MTPLERFCLILRSRSKENIQSFDLLFRNGLYGNCFAILRQELDSMVRVIYLRSIQDNTRCEAFINQTLRGEKWSFTNQNGKKQHVTDRDMVDLSNNLNGWTQNVYKFGCAFIHLSHFHDYQSQDPFATLPDDEKDNIIDQLQLYHGARLSRNSKLTDLIHYLPSIMEKINANFECEIAGLEGA